MHECMNGRTTTAGDPIEVRSGSISGSSGSSTSSTQLLPLLLLLPSPSSTTLPPFVLLSFLPSVSSIYHLLVIYFIGFLVDFPLFLDFNFLQSGSRPVECRSSDCFIFFCLRLRKVRAIHLLHPPRSFSPFDRRVPSSSRSLDPFVLSIFDASILRAARNDLLVLLIQTSGGFWL